MAAVTATDATETVLRVGVNLLWCRPGQVGGSEEYLSRQLAGLAAVAPEIAACLLVPPGFTRAHPDLVERFETVIGPTATRRRSARVVAEALSLPKVFADVDVVHHAGGTQPPRQRTSTLLTIHDVQYLRFPEYFSKGRRTYLRLRMPPSARSATAIAVASEYVRGTVIEAFGVDADKVVVVPHGYDPPPAASIPQAGELRQRYGLGDRRVLVYPAITHPHKGHRLLIELLAGPWSDPELVLVLLGGRGAADRDVNEAIVTNRVGERVIRAGRVPPWDRDGLVALAEAVVFPSEYEGFGAPVLEAMALGTPVICSDQAALPEISGDACVVVPLTMDAWSGALATVASDSQRLIERGLRRASQFTTAASGLALAAAYRVAAAGERP
jgi:glycosyltransferase involved in cell wall biosynthesis